MKQSIEEYRACASLVVDHAAPGADDVVLDLGTGTGAIALALAEDAGRVEGRDISEGTAGPEKCLLEPSVYF